jgi:hypothetical protein
MIFSFFDLKAKNENGTDSTFSRILPLISKELTPKLNGLVLKSRIKALNS